MRLIKRVLRALCFWSGYGTTQIPIVSSENSRDVRAGKAKHVGISVGRFQRASD